MIAARAEQAALQRLLIASAPRTLGVSRPARTAASSSVSSMWSGEKVLPAERDRADLPARASSQLVATSPYQPTGPVSGARR